MAKDNESARKGGVTNGWMSGRNSDRMGRKSEFGADLKLCNVAVAHIYLDSLWQISTYTT